MSVLTSLGSHSTVSASEVALIDEERWISLARMPVIDVRKMCVTVLAFRVLMRVGVRLFTVPIEISAVLMMFVMAVPSRMSLNT